MASWRRGPRPSASGPEPCPSSGDAALFGDELTVAEGMTMDMDDMAQVMGEVAVRIAGTLGLGPGIQQGLWQVYERWDGKGAPKHLRGEQLSLSAGCRRRGVKCHYPA
jgi:hypothetical protein